MGSAPSKTASVTITKVSEFKPKSPRTQSDDSKVQSLVQKPVIPDGSETKPDQTEVTLKTKTGDSSNGVTKAGQKHMVERKDCADEGGTDVITLRRGKPLHTKLPPIHYVEKNEGGLVVEDVEPSANRAGKDTDGHESPDTERPSSSTFPRETQSDLQPGKTESSASSTSLPEVECKGKNTPAPLLEPINPGKVGKLGVSGEELLLQLQRQGIVSVHGTHHVDSSTIIGQLTHLGLIPDSSNPGASQDSVVYDENERRKIPARLARLNHSEVHYGAFPNPEEKRRRLRNRQQHVSGCGVQMNEDVVNNAIQRACVRERQQTKKGLPPDKDDGNEELKEKILGVELL